MSVTIRKLVYNPWKELLSQVQGRLKYWWAFQNEKHDSCVDFCVLWPFDIVAKVKSCMNCCCAFGNLKRDTWLCVSSNIYTILLKD